MVVLQIITLMSINYPMLNALNHLKKLNDDVENTFTQQTATNEKDKFIKLMQSYEAAKNSPVTFPEKSGSNLEADFKNTKNVVTSDEADDRRFFRVLELSRLLNDAKSDSSITNTITPATPQTNASVINEFPIAVESGDQNLKMEQIFTTFSTPDEMEYEYNFQRTDNITIGMTVAISIVVFLIIVINCFTFRIYLKERKDDQSFRSDITESSSSRTTYRYRGGSSPHFHYEFYDDNI